MHPAQASINEQVLRVSRRIAQSFTVNVPGRPGVPDETPLAWLSRLMWLTVEEGRVRVTSLGRAVLGSLEQASFEEEFPVAVVLDEGDPLATPRVIGQIAEVGPCALIDPYVVPRR